MLTLHIAGMMCEHCEASVQNALLSLPFIQSAEADHVKGTADIVFSGDADMQMIKDAIKSKGYKVKR